MENTLQVLENKLTNTAKKQQYELLKCELDKIYDKNAESVRVRRRCQHYEYIFSMFGKSARFLGESLKTYCKIADPQKIEHEIFL